MRKRMLSLFLVCATLLSSLAGCSGGGNAAGNNTGAAASGGTKTLRVAWWGNQARNDRTTSVLKMYSKENPGVTFETEFSGEYWDKMATQAAAGTLPDLIQMDYAYIDQYQKKNQLADLKPYINQKIIDTSGVSEDIVKTGTIDGGIYGLALGINAPCLLYDKDIVTKAGVTIKDNMTRDDFIAASKQIYQKTGAQTIIFPSNLITYLAFVVRGEGYTLYGDSKLGVPDQKPIEDFFKLYEQGVSEGWYLDAGKLSASDTSIEQGPFVTQNTWDDFAFSNQIVAYDQAKGKDLGVTTFPVGKGDAKKAMYLKPSMFFSIAKTSKYPEDCAKVINYFTNSVEANDVLLAERGVPVSSKVADAIKPKLSKGDQGVFDYVNSIQDQCSQIDPPDPQGTAEVITTLNNLVEEVCFKKKTAQQAAQEFYTKANEILAKAS